MSDPKNNQDWQVYHERVLQGDPTAFAELCEAALPDLLAYVQRRFSDQEQPLLFTVVHDSLLKYADNPSKYDPSRGLSLRAYLRMDIRGDVRNAGQKQRTQEKPLVSLGDELVELRQLARNTVQEEIELDEWLQEFTELTREELLEQLTSELTPLDEDIVLAMVDGVRKTEDFAAIMGITHLPHEEQVRLVKRAKDRLQKTLERFGKRNKRL